MTSLESIYCDGEAVKAKVAEGLHREIIGGMWDEIGALQFEFLKKSGLKAGHTLLDVGCGCLRGGVHFVGYLDPGHYVGVDINPSLLDAGYDVELAKAGLRERLPRGNLVCIGDFDVSRLGRVFDYAIAVSLFTHLNFNRIRQCLERLVPAVRSDGIFLASFFELPEGAPASDAIRHQPGGVVTHGTEDPYHYRFQDLRHAAAGLPWNVIYIGDWGHPRGQRMAAFVRQSEARVVGVQGDADPGGRGRSSDMPSPAPSPRGSLES